MFGTLKFSFWVCKLARIRRNTFWESCDDFSVTLKTSVNAWTFIIWMSGFTLMTETYLGRKPHVAVKVGRDLD